MCVCVCVRECVSHPRMYLCMYLWASGRCRNGFNHGWERRFGWGKASPS